VEGIDDTGGRVFFEIPAAAALAPGRHRIHLSVAGDRTGADLVLQVAHAGTPVFVADIDGTLTRSGTAEFRSLVRGTLPPAHPFAPDALHALAARGYVPLYLSGRPEPLLNRTRAFLAQRGFPPGLVMTTARKSGAIGSAAARFKSETLARALTGRGFVAAYAFGDTPSDAEAYASARVQHRFFYRYLDATHGGRRFDSYQPLVADLRAAPLHCSVAGSP
jgi:phosphatidate phosphatase PAH1